MGGVPADFPFDQFWDPIFSFNVGLWIELWIIMDNYCYIAWDIVDKI